MVVFSLFFWFQCLHLRHSKSNIKDMEKHVLCLLFVLNDIKIKINGDI